MARSASAADMMWRRLFRRFEDRESPLQTRLRDMLVHALAEGFIAPGAPLPSSRSLALALGISRTTVTLVLQALCDKGLIQARARSGYFADSAPVSAPLGALAQRADAADADLWSARIKQRPSAQRNIRKPLDWQQQPYPFIYGQWDVGLFPFRDWRSCVLESLQAQSVRRWAVDHIDRDEDSLVTQIHGRLLPARGIWVERDEILVTNGAQHASYLLASVLMDSSTRIGIEDPGYPDARNVFSLRSSHVLPLPVDSDGLVLSPTLAQCDYVYLTPSHQCPTTVTMSLARRVALLEKAREHDIIVLEDDHESELNFAGRPTPALKSLDNEGRVLYLGSLSKTLAHGLRLGYLVAPAPLVRELRAMRRLMTRHVSTNNQQAAASFIAHGFHDAYLRRLNLAYRERARVLTAALAQHAPQLQPMPTLGGSALWVQGPHGLDSTVLASRLLARGVVIEPGAVFYADAPQVCNSMRIGYSSIAADQIDPGVRLIAAELREFGFARP